MRFGKHLLSDQTVINWCYKPATRDSLVTTSKKTLLQSANKTEKAWARGLIGGEGSQWTTLLCQELVKEALIELGRENVRRTKGMKGSIRKKTYEPDLECNEYVYEVKGRSWTTPGTAGEKILGVPLKYGELPKLYGKPLRIILVGYQEYEARNGYAFGDLLDRKIQTTELRESLEYFRKHNIEYIGFTDILNQLGYSYKEQTNSR